MSLPATILSLCEQLVPTENKPENYIAPLVQWMTDDWKRIKRQLADYIMAVASGDVLAEASEVWFPQGQQNLIQQMIDSLLAEYKKNVNDKAKEIVRDAKIDSNMPGLTDWTDMTPIQIKLSKEGVQEVIDGLQWQKDFVDEVKADTKTRIGALLKSRYGSLGEFRKNINRAFRIDKDEVIDRFKNEVYGFADRVIAGSMDVDDFVIAMRRSIESHYKRSFKIGKGVTMLDEAEEELILRQAQGQMQYLKRFAEYIKQQQVLGKYLTTAIRARAGLYAERSSAMFEAGAIAAMPADVLLDWVMHPAEHCTTCPIYASNSPYTKATLPGYPGEGFHLTECGVNCKCSIEISELYVTQKDLGVGKGFKPIPEVPVNIMPVVAKTVSTS